MYAQINCAKYATKHGLWLSPNAPIRRLKKYGERVALLQYTIIGLYTAERRQVCKQA
jgi:hypothetical protein